MPKKLGKSGTRLFALFLSVMMLIGILPMSAFAATLDKSKPQKVSYTYKAWKGHDMPIPFIY